MAGIPVRAQDEIIRAGRRMDQRGWVPATAGNISVRLPTEASTDPRFAITRSGGHKGFVDGFSVIEVDLQGRAVAGDTKPSAETLLHCQIYRRFSQAGAVLHGHSVAGTVLSMVNAADTIVFTGYELFKAFAGQTTHNQSLSLPLFSNDQDIPRLAEAIEPFLGGASMGYYLRGHGVYVWGADMNAALASLEAIEFLLECELARRQLSGRYLETTS